MVVLLLFVFHNSNLSAKYTWQCDCDNFVTLWSSIILCCYDCFWWWSINVHKVVPSTGPKQLVFRQCLIGIRVEGHMSCVLREKHLLRIAATSRKWAWWQMKYLVLAQHELELQCILLLVQRKKSQVNKRQRQSSRQPRGIVQCSQKDEVRGMRGLGSKDCEVEQQEEQQE